MGWAHRENSIAGLEKLIHKVGAKITTPPREKIKHRVDFPGGEEVLCIIKKSNRLLKPSFSFQTNSLKF